MIKAVFIDFYGTVVHEDGEVIRQVTEEIFNTGKAESKAEIDIYWWKEFQEAFLNSYGKNFQHQRELEYKSLAKTIEHFQSTADAKSLSELLFAHWVKPPIFPEAKQFFEDCSLPVYIVSNIDRADILEALAFHGLEPAGIFTSEDAESYKPRRELFELALKESGLQADEVIHIGDSLSSDVKGASALGIKAIWVNRGDRPVPEGVTAVSSLLEVLETI